MRRWKRGGVGGGDTTLTPRRVASCLISSRGVARKNVSGVGGTPPLTEEVEGMKVGTSESSSHAGRLTSWSWRGGADVGGATIDGEG